MTATDELRRMLDERGVEWTGGHFTDWDDANGHPAEAFEFDGTLYVSCVLTPEQAVEDTLGMGTCRVVSMRERDKRPYLHDELVCSECGCQLAHEFEHVWQRFCPNCGRKVVDA